MRKLTIATITVLAALFMALPAIGAGGGANPDHITVLDGADRYETAAQIALTTGGPDATFLYIANGETLVDATVVGATSNEDGTHKILLVQHDNVPDATEAALRQIAHAELVFLGGDDVISPAVRDEVASLTDNYAHPN